MLTRTLVVACVAALFIGLILDDAVAQNMTPPLPPPCDQICRMRTIFQYCSDGTCWQLSATDCFLCVNPVGTTNEGQCLPAPGDSGGTCTATDQRIFQVQVSICTPSCACLGFNNVEASNPGATVTSFAWPRYMCQ